MRPIRADHLPHVRIQSAVSGASVSPASWVLHLGCPAKLHARTCNVAGMLTVNQMARKLIASVRMDGRLILEILPLAALILMNVTSRMVLVEGKILFVLDLYKADLVGPVRSAVRSGAKSHQFNTYLCH